jgi:hypothetical protein
MSYKVDLDLDGKTFEVLRCLCRCEQKFDNSGTPSSGVSGGALSLLIAGTSEDTFASWISDPQKTMDGTITFSVQDSPYKKIEFKSAYITKLNESFNAEGEFDNNPLERTSTKFADDMANEFIFEQVLHYQNRLRMSYIMQCTISAEVITIDGVEHDNHWAS